MAQKKSGQLFAAAQQIGKSLFLPIAVLPFAGILLGIGSSFTNETTIATYGLSGILHPGTILYSLMMMLNYAGNAIFSNLALIFALAVALGMAKKEKGVAVLSAGIFYLIMLTTISVLLTLTGSIVDGEIADTVKEGAITSMLGIQTLQMGVFGGIIAGVIAAVLCNKFYKTQLPDALSFFAGTRFVPIVSMIFGIVTGAILFIVWPMIQNGIFALGSLVQASGYAGTFIYGCIERALIPFGLHHIFYMPFWQTGVGGSAVIDGVTVMGAQNIFFAQLASPETTKFSVDACRFLTGKYPFMMGGLPGAALAMYMTARPEKKKQTGSLLFSVALTSFLTGVTEPIEFTFLFLAPALFAIHVVFAGLSFMTCHILNICVGTTFSDGLIDLILYGVLPGQAKSNWIMLIPVIAVYFVLYFVVFRFFILKWDLKTPGREEDGEEAHLVTKDEYRKATGVGVAGGKAAIAAANIDEKSAAILRGVGGVDNLVDIDCCATRLRLTLVDSSNVDQALLKSTGASGVVVKGAGIQVIYGPSVTIVKSNFEEFVEQVRSGAIPTSAFMGVSEEPVAAEAPAKADTPKLHDVTLSAHMNGQMLLLTEVKDEAFASCALGDGIAIEPSEGKLYAPADAVVVNVFDTKHAIGLAVADEMELLLHIGIDTVKLGGKHFEAHVKEGQQVKKGDLLVSFDMDAIKKEGYLCTTPMIVCNTDEYHSIRPLVTGQVEVGQNLLEVKG
ncbi:MAG: glucose PTS transporter subunit IIA [Eubacteriales bacterium]|nr:glucose PTS transporter subunit IIA [Eubacteriales bacterium]